VPPLHFSRETLSSSATNVVVFAFLSLDLLGHTNADMLVTSATSAV
jgi:hypothetical protein